MKIAECCKCNAKSNSHPLLLRDIGLCRLWICGTNVELPPSL